MAIKISSTDVIDNSRNLVNIANANVSGISTLGITTALHLNVTGFSTVSGTTNSSSTTTGSLQTRGGLGVSSHVFVGTGLSVVSGVSTFSGNVGINSFNPNARLSVVGSSRFTGISTFTGSIGINTGLLGGAGLSTRSSLTVNNNLSFSPIGDATVVVNNLYPGGSLGVYDVLTDSSSRSAMHIDISYNQRGGYGVINPIPDWKNSNIVLEKGNGDYQPGSIIRGRLYEDGNSGISEYAIWYNNGYSSMYPNTTSNTISFQTAGFNPASDPLQHGTINTNTIITTAGYSPYQAREFGAGGTGRIGFCYITYGGDVVIRTNEEAGTYVPGVVNGGVVFNDPGQAVQTIIDSPVGTGVSVKYTPDDYSVIGVTTDTQSINTKDATRDVLGKVIKVSGSIDSKASTSEYFCLTQRGYVWATTQHNTYGFLNQNNTTNIQRPIVVWDIADYDQLDRYAAGNTYAPKIVINLTGTHDMSDDSDNTGTVYYCKTYQATDQYHEMWNTGGYNAYGQLADGTITNRSFAKACIFHAADQITAEPGITTTGTYVHSSNGTSVGVAGTFMRITFTGGTDPALYNGEYIYLDFTTGTAVDDTYVVVDSPSAGVYQVIRHTGKNTYANTSLTTNGNFQMMGRSQMMRKLNRQIIGQWSGGGNLGVCYIQDDVWDIWFVGETSAGISGDGNITIDRKAFKNISGLSTTPISAKASEIVKLSIVGTDGGFMDTFILFSDWTLWHAGKNTSGYSYGNATQKNTWNQIAGPGYASTGPDGSVYNFWIRERSSGGAASADSLFVVDYSGSGGTGYMLWCCGENSSYHLANGGTVDSLRWITPTKFPTSYGTSTSKSPTITDWIPEQMWPTSQGGSTGNGMLALFRNLTTNEYRIYAWGYNGSLLLGVGNLTPPLVPTRVHFGVPAYKIKDLKVFSRDTNYDGIGLAITYDGEIYGIGGAKYASSASPVTYLVTNIWHAYDEGPRYYYTWNKINPLSPY